MNMKKIYSFAAIALVALLFCTYIIGALFDNLLPAIKERSMAVFFNPAVLLNPLNYLYGLIGLVIIVVLYAALRPDSFSRTKKSFLGSNKKNEVKDSTLENSRFMTDKERDFNFAPHEFAKLGESKKDGIPVRAWYDKKGLHVNLASPMHGLIIGATGSGKTTTFINPMIQILAKSGAGSSMICTDPKGELFQLHSKFLQERGYKVMVLDLRDPYSSFRWNPLSDIFDRYQEYVSTGNDIYVRSDSAEKSGLELVNPPELYGDEWY